jgi:transposase
MGTRIEEPVFRLRHSRTTVIAAYRQNKIEAFFRFKRPTNTEVFNYWVNQYLIPILEKDDWVILDNAAFHKSPQTKMAVEAKGAHLLFLPPYSPDLNKIEHQWARLKAGLRGNKYNSPDFVHNLDHNLMQM